MTEQEREAIITEVLQNLGLLLTLQRQAEPEAREDISYSLEA